MSILVMIFIVIVALWLAGQAIGMLFGLLLAGIAGYFASRVTGGDGVGTIGNVLLGLVGGLIGPSILSIVNLGGIANIPLLGVILSSLVGAVVVIFVARLFNRNFAK